MEELKAKISEIFHSIQGEGIYIGYPQIFIRFWGCNLENCRFCDTQGLQFQEYTIQDLIQAVASFKETVHSISITGGEPLLQVEFLEKFLSLYKTDNKIYLETNGTLPDALERIINCVDIIAMDIKLPSSTGLADYWKEHRKFLLIAWEKSVFVKTVITRVTTLEDIQTAVELVLSVDPTIPFILQPASEEINSDFIETLINFQDEANKSLLNVRIIPQIHKFLYIK